LIAACAFKITISDIKHIEIFVYQAQLASKNNSSRQRRIVGIALFRPAAEGADVPGIERHAAPLNRW
jgi:hypothetical protein